MLNKVLKSCQNVMSNSKNVVINFDVLDKFVDNLEFRDMKHWLVGNPYGLLDLDVSTIINFLLYFEAIDYCFWGDPKWTIETDEGLKDGCDALLYAMLSHVKSCGKVNFGEISFADFSNLLKGIVDIPFLRERYDSLVSIGEQVNKNMNGDFYGFVKDTRVDKDLFDVIISNFDCFKDERIYLGEKVYFYKLAQLLVSDILHIRNILEKIDADFSHLVGCADYKIPQTLRALDIIQYNEELANLVDNKCEITVSSMFEVKIRASVIVVIDYIKSRLCDTKAIDINDYFFLASSKIKVKKPYHLTININY